MLVAQHSMKTKSFGDRLRLGRVNLSSETVELPVLAEVAFECPFPHLQDRRNKTCLAKAVKGSNKNI